MKIFPQLILKRLFLLSCLLGCLLGPFLKPDLSYGQSQEANPQETKPQEAQTQEDQGLRQPASNTIQQINVKGNSRIETDAILTQIKVKKSFNYTTAQLHQTVREDVQRLYQMGYFYNIKVDHTDQTLTYTITEKPSITKINFEGNDSLSDEDLQAALDIKPYQFLNISSIRLAADKMQKLYEEKGFFLASVDYDLQYLQNNAADLTFQIEENDRVKVRDITILGNENISDDLLRSVMLTKKKGFFSFLSGSGQYRKEFFERDVQVLKILYYNEGYINVEIDMPRVYISPDRKNIAIRISIEEGKKYKIGNVDVVGDELFSSEELLKEVSIKDSEFFAYNVLQGDLSRLQAMYGDLGYAYTNVVPQTRVDEENSTVNLTFEIDKGEKVFIKNITIVGNEKTRDKVIRRELRIKEGELYNETDKRRSLANVRRLGYFEDVILQQKINPDDPTTMDIEIQVKERSTDSIQLQVGYNGRNGFMGTVRLQSYNLFGRGQSLALGATLNSANYNAFQRPLGLDYFFQFTEPYFVDTLWSVGIDVYHTEFYMLEDNYRENRTGGGLRLGYPLADYLRGFINYKYYHTTLTPDDNFDDTVPTFKTFYDHPDTANGSRSVIGISLEYDRRDDRLYPRNGVFFSSSLDYAGIGGSKKYIEGSFNARFFKEIFKTLVIRNNLTYAFLKAPHGRHIPFNQLLRLGGADTLRGYDWFTVGKAEYSERRKAEKVVGGTQQFYYNLELQFPLVSRMNLQGVLFFDAGFADDVFYLQNFRSNVGFGFRLNTPISPIRIEFGIPIAKKRGESGFVLQFDMGKPAPF